MSKKAKAAQKAKRQKNRREFLRAAEAARAILHERYPKAFLARGADKLPLKVGIAKELRKLCGDLSSRQLHCALRDYTGGKKYLAALLEGATRIGLDGEPAGVVTDLEAVSARARLERLEALFERIEAWRKKRPLRDACSSTQDIEAPQAAMPA